MKKISTQLKVGATAILISLSALRAQAQVIYGTINNNVLASFNASTPGTLTSTVSITGITLGQTIEGLDFRPNTGQLYAFGYNALSSLYQVYTINPSTGAATALNTATTIALGNGPIGFDFNPTVDRIRVVSANGANYRLHPVTGLIVFTDGNLSFASGDANFGATPKIVTAGYTNSYIGAATTALYNYDNNLNVITLQNPPNNGSLTTVGSSGITTNTTTPMVDMDIFYDNTISANMAYLVANNATNASMDELYSINLSNGSVTLIGAIGDADPVSNIAVFIDRTLPTLTGQLAYGLSGNNLISFDTQNPSYIRSIATLTGVTAGQTLVGMDFRPATGMLYGLGYNSTNNEAQVYNINIGSALATPVNTAVITLTLAAVNVGVDFNPTVDRIRVVSNNDMNYRLDPATGTISATDINVNFAAADVNAGADPNVGTVAYTNSIHTATSTTLYNYDEVLNILTTQLPPNNGTLNTLGSTGIIVNPADPTVDMDIYYDDNTMTNSAFLAANVNTDTNDNLYSVNLTNGATTLVGKIGFGIPVRDIAIQTPMPVTGIADAKLSNTSLVTIYPNPLSENTTINIVKNSVVEVFVMDITGRTISTNFDSQIKTNNTIFNWNTDGLERGIYFVHVKTNDDKQQVIKVVK